jgi:myo-inositol-1(or 4)-monophosphatase
LTLKAGELMWETELQVARDAATAAGEIIERYYRQGVTMRSKETANLVSDADVEAERAIVELLRARFPDHAVLAEEGHSHGQSEHLWIVDPLDGTNNFAHHIPQFAVSIAYCHHGQPMCGVVYNPIRGDWHTAVRGEGAFLNGQRVRVDASARLADVLVAVGFYYDRGAMMEATLAALRDFFLAHVHGIRRFGAASLDLCSVGLGMFGAYFEYELAPWDFAAGALFVEEAGGKVTTCSGAALPLERTTLLASNTLLHEAALAIVRRHLPPGGFVKAT